MASNTQLRRAMITINNLEPGEKLKEELWASEWAVNRIRRWVYQIEKGEEGGRLHAQLYIEFKDKARFSTIKNWLNEFDYKDQKAPHIEPPRSKSSVCYNYCSKEETRVEGPFKGGDWSNMAGQGRRTDLDEACEMIKEKRTLEEIADALPSTWAKYHKGLESLHTMAPPERVKERNITNRIIRWIWGPSRVGKSTYSYSGYKWEEIYCKNESQWWDGYNGRLHKAIVFNDYEPRPGGIRFRDFVNIADKFPMIVQLKGRSTQLGMQDIIVTSNESPQSMFRHEKDLTPLLARFEIVHMDWKTTTYTKTNVDDDGNISETVTVVDTKTLKQSLL